MEVRKIITSLYQLLVFGIFLQMAKCDRPGIYFWRPRLSLDLAIPTTPAGSTSGRMPTKDDILSGMVVLVDGYAVGLTIIALASGLSSESAYPYLSPRSPYFYTNLYRWMLRYSSMLPHWIGGHGGNFVETHKTWKRRFYYMDEFMPKWMQKILPIKQEEWDKEYLEWKRYKKYAEPAFGKHYRYPSKKFNNFRSMETEETFEINYQEVSSESL